MAGGIRFGIWIVCATLGTATLAIGWSAISWLDARAVTAGASMSGGSEQDRESARSDTLKPHALRASAERETGNQIRTEAERFPGTPSGEKHPQTAAWGGESAGRDGRSNAFSDRSPGRDPSRVPGERGTARAVDDAFPPAGVSVEEARFEELELAADGANADFDRTGSEGDSYPSVETSDFDRADIIFLEQEAARAAEALGLLDPAEIERRVQRRVPDGSLPPSEMARAREDARRVILADAAIIEDLTRANRLTSRSMAKQARGWAEMLLPTIGPESRARKLEGVAQRLGL